MTQATKGIQIVQYNDSWAKAVAQMWNLSRDSWGGGTQVMTEEQVKRREANSDNIELFLAVDGEEVVGYCGLSEYKEDTGSLYIPLLNVRPDYHGKKIGKQLLLKALKKTVEMGWPRLDLYTWAGNTKAVPLYKKCGFFWEERDDTTHLMNFIPLVISMPLLKPVFETLDWYKSSERIIEVKPDGIKENGFSFFEYQWKNEDQFARVQIERTGRGMSLVETDDFFLQLQLTEHEVIKQEKLPYQIKFINKTSTPASLRVEGSANERVIYNIYSEMMVDREAVLTETLTVNHGEEPSNWKTHPYLSVKVTVNGEDCELRLGVFPVQPAKITAETEENRCFLNKKKVIDLEIKNNFKEEAEYTILFPESELVSLEQDSFTVSIPAGGRTTLPVPIIPRKYGFYQSTLAVTAKKRDGVVLSFTQEISTALKGLGEKFGGESKDYWNIFNGLSQVNVRKRDLLMTIAKNNKKDQPLAFFPPKLGKPYSNEFTKKKPEHVSWEIAENAILIKMSLYSGEKQGIYLSKIVKLYGEGIAETWVELENKHSDIHENMAVSTPLYHELGPTYFPLDDQLVYFKEGRILEFGDINSSRITGYCYLSENAPDPIGIAWSAKSKAGPEGWQFVIEDEFGTLQPGEKVTGEKIMVSIGAFKEWDDFNVFAGGVPTDLMKDSTNELTLASEKAVQSQNESLSLTLKTYRNSYLDGKLQVSANAQKLLEATLHPEDEKTTYSITLDSTTLNPLTVIEADFTSKSSVTRAEEMILVPFLVTGTVQFTNNLDEISGVDTFEASNGCITITAAPDFYPGIYSLKVNGKEWLDHCFPTPTTKSWWNPWSGGMKTIPSGLTTFSIQKEKHTLLQVEKEDREGNKWSGIAIETNMQEHKDWKGVQFFQYYLMLPGVPVLVSFIEVKSSGGKNLKNISWVTDFFLGGEELPNLSVHGKMGEQTDYYRAGVEEIPIRLEPDYYFSSNTKKEKLYLIPSLNVEHTEAYTNKHAFQTVHKQPVIQKEDGISTAPLFLLFEERVLSKELLFTLRRIQF